MSKYKWSLNLQLFAEGGDEDDFDDDFDSLPEDDDFDVEIEEPEEPSEPTEEPTIAPEEEPEPTPEPLFKLKYNGEEREIPGEEFRALAQKGMNYEKAIERAEQAAAQKARDSYIAEQGYEWNGNPITTEAQYKQALAEQDMRKKYEDRDIPDEVIQELMEGRRDREERKREKEAAQEQATQAAAIDDFLNYFQRVNERPFDSVKDSIPQEVKDAVDNGDSLKSAYQEWHNKTLLSQLKAMKQNESNKQKAPVGSVTAFGSNKTEAVDPFLAAFDED